MGQDRLLTVQQVAERFGTSVRYVRYLTSETHQLTFIRLGRKVRIPESAVTAMIQAGTVPARKTWRAA